MRRLLYLAVVSLSVVVLLAPNATAAAIYSAYLAYRAWRHKSKVPIRNVLGTCNRRVVWTATHAQIRLDKMFDALDQVRIKVQEQYAHVEPEDQQQRVEDVYEALYCIDRCRRDWENGSLDRQGLIAKIDPAKLRILATLEAFATAAGVTNPLTTTLRQDT